MLLTPDALLLRRLRCADFIPASGFSSASDLATQVAALNAAGYQIEHHPHLGYKLRYMPDRLIADEILSRLPDCRWLRDIRVFEATASTNDLIAGLGRDGAAAGVAIFAEEQTAGRGRLGRRWESEGRLGLWFSLLLRPGLPLAGWPRITLWLAYALATGIERCCGVRPDLKWPNDLYLGGRKLSGILVETTLGERPFAAAGIGLNVNHTLFPPPIDATATSVRLHAGMAVDRNALAAAILQAIDETSDQMEPDADPEPVLAWAAGTDCLRGRWITADTGAAVIEGRAEGIDDDGSLLVRTAPGGVLRLASGEITRFFAGGR